MSQILSQNEDTIVALATPPGIGAISVIRVSGPETFIKVDKVFQGKKKIADSPTHTIHYGKIIDLNNEIIDDVLISVFRAPNSYTGEDSVEISTHGSQLIVEKIISLLVEQNIRLAEPGEFTKRAFLNGKLDLAQAEAVADVINSRTEASLRGARNQLDGILSKKVDSLREKLINTSSLIELELDFAEEDIELLPVDEILKNINEIESEIENLLSTFSFGRVIRDGVNVALVGKPNVGKSSLLNYLLKEARAIVSEIPGTTRDVIREELTIDGILFRLHDTAGIRMTEDIIEKEGVLRSRNVVKEADIVLFLNDIETGFDEGLFQEILSLNKEDKILKVVNKIDLKKINDNRYDVGISAKTGEGIEDLFQKLKEKAIGTNIYTEKTAIVSNIRHYNALKKAKEHLINAKISISEKLTGEFIAVDLRNAENSLSEIIGKVTTDDILNNIFSKFCIGK
ncbi:MAG: tRNA uridine-5-carboxymethylaminomethyl(34) synthesis GTPase MnmE [Melioribacter sp.]|uniref:tRNA uridine-5-carboxymethylaminomethyl(34) synthesis GTPase MnmE n=1 Tax=Rosettibacter primus TaxID=3111523 RepID=UPI00247E9C1A|nr:tRNA uridine-5-carboxymethylaminomethyl(34) synthesis GTPase MnmE [Melioribacter sp.]